MDAAAFDEKILPPFSRLRPMLLLASLLHKKYQSESRLLVVIRSAAG